MGAPPGWDKGVVTKPPPGWDDAAPVPAQEPTPMPSIEGASPWEVGDMPTGREMKPYVRGAAQVAVGLPAGIAASPAAGGAVATLAGMAVDAAYGDLKKPDDYTLEAAGNILIPGVGGALVKNAGPFIKRKAGEAAVSLYQSAAKYPTTLKMADKTRITLTGLRERILFNPQSLKRLGNLNDELTSVADEAMIYAQMRGEGVPTQGIKDAFWKTTNRMKKDPVFDKRISDGLQTSYGKAIEELPAYMSPQEVIAWRRSLNEQLSGYFDRMKKAGLVGGDAAMKKAKESVRASVNSEILGMVPELKALGQRQRDIIDVLTYTERATSRISNWDVLGLGSLVVGDIMADAAGVNSNTKSGALGVAAAGMLAWRIAGSPNAKARIAFMLAKVGKLDSASVSTLQLIGLTRDAARNLSPKMKALPFPRAMGSGSKPGTSGIVKGGQETVHAEEGDAYEKAWRQYADRDEGQFEVTPQSPRLTDRAPMPNEYGGPAPSPKMLADPGRFRNPAPSPYGGAVTSRARAIVDSVRMGQMHPALAAKELTIMSNDALVVGDTYAAKTYRELAKGLSVR